MAIHVVGLGIDPDALPEIHEQLISSADILVGGKRQLAAFTDCDAFTIPVTAPLSAVFATMLKHYNNRKEIVVIADGDPLFFGIGDRIIKEFGAENVVVHSNTATVQAISTRASIPWQQMRMVSLHGRNDYTPLYTALMHENNVAVLTDETNIPAVIAQKLLDRGAAWFRMWIFENMGTQDERITRCTLEEASKQSFSSLNTVLLERTGTAEQPLRLGIPDALFETEQRLITKKPIRAASLSALELQPEHILWDVGAGSGAISIEASYLLSKGAIFAIERKAERVEFIRANRARFGAINIDVRHGDILESIQDLPTPDRIFVGGGLGSNAAMLSSLTDRLTEGGMLVVNCTLLSTLEAAKQHFTVLGWEYEVLLTQASLSTPLAGDMRLDAMNPIFSVIAHKPLTEKTTDIL
ncbi:MAG: precorrin-6y C5,15-methyltransferase (decarboxylating) subunit CbiE [Desulfovibrionales bacterium]|nr:precorrin-6y C5,15-methyltransferase (decarboxylating) subunit CbiE [Desulfovibrionales bacterium]